MNPISWSREEQIPGARKHRPDRSFELETRGVLGGWERRSGIARSAIVLPMSGWLSNIIGRKRFYMLCVAMFTISSFLCAFGQLEIRIPYPQACASEPRSL